jgi:hypothetical protein
MTSAVHTPVSGALTALLQELVPPLTAAKAGDTADAIHAAQAVNFTDRKRCDNLLSAVTKAAGYHSICMCSS